MENKDILDFKVGTQTIREMSAITFLGWLAKKIDGQPSYSASIVELSMAVSHPPMTGTMEDNGKIDLVRKLLRAGITL